MGRGDWWRHDRKITVEECQCLDVAQLIDNCPELQTHGGDTAIAQVSYNVRGQDVAYSITLESTRLYNGGRRWWLLCPRVIHGRPCGRRVAKLYLPNGGIYYWCRHCYQLTYRSCQESDSRFKRFMVDPAALGLPVEKWPMFAIKGWLSQEWAEDRRLEKAMERQAQRKARRKQKRPGPTS